MKFNTKKEFAEALLEGRRFKSCDNIIRFDENHAEPFRYGDDPIMGAWSGMELEEIVMNKKLKVAVSPLTNTIFAGKILKEGIWASGKQDVTMDCLNAVSEHVKNFGKPVEVIDKDTGKLIYKITVEWG